MAYGILNTADTLATQRQSVADYGEDRTWAALEADLNAHNRIFNELAMDLVERTTDRLRAYGGSDDMVMDEVDEFGRGDTQKVNVGVTVGFPLRLFDLSIGWTRKYLQNTSVAEVAGQMTAAQKAHIKALQRDLKRAVFYPTNVSFVDRLVSPVVTLGIKRFLNADGDAIPNGPNGETFTPGSHTHYLYTAGTSLAAADLTAQILTVAEHYNSGQVRVYINAAQETAVRALTGFTPITPTFVTPATSAAAIVQNYDRTNLGNRQIGYFGGNYAEVWVKPWVPAGYLFAFVDGAPKPLCLRERRAGSSNLVIAVQDESYPLRAETMEAEFGVAAWNRTNGAALFIDASSAGAYVAPTIA